ncbi:MAG: hypothetical protein INF78_09960 [Roseomonas sp.]|nr:hypothetical protein [Roseomonas sp.]
MLLRILGIPSTCFPQLGELAQCLTKPPIENNEQFANPSPHKNSLSQNFPKPDWIFRVHGKIKSLIEKILRHLPSFSAIIQFLPS